MFKSFCLATCLFFAGTRARTEPLSLKILSYNLHHGEGVDARLDLKRIAGIINSVQPDYAGLQEVDSPPTAGAS